MQVLIYFDIGFSDITIRNLQQLIDEDAENELGKLFQEKTAGMDGDEKKKFLRWIFYGDHDMR